MKFIHGKFSHTFEYKFDREPCNIRFCYASDDNRLVAMEILTDYSEGHVFPVKSEFLDVEEALRDSGILAVPAEHGLEVSDLMPEWAMDCLKVKKCGYYADPKGAMIKEVKPAGGAANRIASASCPRP